MLVFQSSPWLSKHQVLVREETANTEMFCVSVKLRVTNQIESVLPPTDAMGRFPCLFALLQASLLVHQLLVLGRLLSPRQGTGGNFSSHCDRQNDERTLTNFVGLFPLSVFAQPQPQPTACVNAECQEGSSPPGTKKQTSLAILAIITRDRLPPKSKERLGQSFFLLDKAYLEDNWWIIVITYFTDHFWGLMNVFPMLWRCNDLSKYDSRAKLAQMNLQGRGQSPHAGSYITNTNWDFNSPRALCKHQGLLFGSFAEK